MQKVLKILFCFESVFIQSIYFPKTSPRNDFEDFSLLIVLFHHIPVCKNQAVIHSKA